MNPAYQPLATAVRQLAGVCDGASTRDGHGFNGGDANFGRAMAQRDEFSLPMAAALKRMLPRYRRQLGDALTDAVLAVKVQEPEKLVARGPVTDAQLHANVDIALAALTLDVATLLPWGHPVTVSTRYGDKSVRKATIPDGSPFWGHWKAAKQFLIDNGVSIWKNKDTGAWEATLWPKRGTEQQPAAASAPEDCAIPPVEVPDWLKAKLLPYQPPSVAKLAAALKHYGYAVDGSEMGTGKSYAAYAAAKLLGLEVIVCCPKAVKPSWTRAAAHFGGTVFVENYEQFRLGKTPYCEVEKVPQLHKDGTPKIHKSGAKKGKPIVDVVFKWAVPANAVVIIDEAHKCGGDSQQADMAISLVDSGAKRMLLSGTLADNPMGMKAIGYALGLFSKPSKWWSWAIQNGCVKGNFGLSFGSWDMPEDKKRAHQQRHMRDIHESIFGRGKGSRLRTSDLPDFPEVSIQPEIIDFDNNAEIQRAYDDMEDALSRLDEVEAKDRQGIILTEKLRARQRTELLKVPTLARMAQDAIEEGMSVALFVNFDESLKQIAALLKTDCVVDGSQQGQKGEAERERNIQRFQRGNFPRLGLVCVNFSAKAVLQAIKRVHRAFDKNAPPQWSDDHSRVIICNIQAGGVGIGLHHLNGLKAIVRLPFASGTVEEDAASAIERKAANIEMLNDGDLTAGLPMFAAATKQLALA